MKLSVRFQLFIVSFGLIVVSLAATDLYLTRAIRTELTQSIQDDLLIRARLVADEASVTTAPVTDLTAWDAVADRLGRVSEVRVTLIRQDGVVIGDSNVETAALSSLENHGTRAEVLAALTQGHGVGSRLSSTIHEHMMYVAVRFSQRGVAAGVARVAEPLIRVDEAVGRAQALVVVAFFVALILSGLMSTFAAQWMSRGVSQLTDAARKMTAGDLSARTRVAGIDELGQLGRALDQLAGSLSQTLNELRTERDLQANILDGMEEGVLVLDREGQVVLMNRALRDMLRAGTSAIGKLLIEVVRHAELHALVKRATNARTTVRGEIDLPGIKPRRLLTHASALSGPEDGVVAVFVDVTDLRRLESMRRDFVANVSHELRTPVMAVKSAAETLRDTALRDPDPKAAQRFVEIIERNSDRLQALIEDLLDLSRMESNQFQLRKERVDIPEVVANVVALFLERAERKKVTLSAKIDKDPQPFLGDSRAIEQVLSNLIDNAVKYCPAGAAIAVSVTSDEHTVRMDVRDNGPGIDAKHIPRLFERFYRVDAGRSREVGGTGLGLSIVKHLVEAMGGLVTVESAGGAGATFTVKVPR